MNLRPPFFHGRNMPVFLLMLSVLVAQDAQAGFGMGQGIITSSEIIINGQNEGSQTGQSLAAMADFNGDGHGDLAIGVPGNNTQDGLVAVFFGQEGQWPIPLNIDGADLLFQGSPNGRSRAGETLEVCDLNGDNLSDLIIGAPNGNEGAGTIYVVFGALDWSSANPEQLLTFHHQFAGVQPGDGAGTSLACPDLDGDGFGDLVVGAPLADGQTTSDTGAIYIKFGESSLGSQGAHGSLAAFDSIYTGVAGSGFATSLATVSNFNGDSYEDLAIGAPEGTEDSFAYVYLLPGKPQIDFPDYAVISAFHVTTYESGYSFDYAGASIAGAGDMNGDGYDELIIGAPRYSPNIQSSLAGRVYMISGQADLPVLATMKDASFSNFIGPQTDSELGHKVSAGGDLTGDGIDDIFISETRAGGSLSSEKGQVYIIPGDQKNWPKNKSILNSDIVLGSFIGINSSDELGGGLGPAFDIDQDGRNEIYIGSPGATISSGTGPTQAGSVYVVDVASIQDADYDGWTIQLGDCDDFDDAIHPEAVDICDGIDNDCNGQIDDPFDMDGDGYSDPDLCPLGTDCNDNDPLVHPEQVESCDDEDQDCDGAIDEDFDGDGDGYLTQENCIFGSDCDDSRDDIYPRADELCDLVDNDCDSILDEGFDADGDGYSDAEVCPNGQDCDDGDPKINPLGEEACDGEKDNDCDGVIDEGFDQDLDGYFPMDLCTHGNDCDDESADIHPGMNESCDGEDNDCDGQMDEGLRSTFYQDSDGDGFGTEASTESCGLPPGYAEVSGDCDDEDGQINPDAQEGCDAYDNDCDGAIDEGCGQDSPTPSQGTPAMHTPTPLLTPSPTGTLTPDTPTEHASPTASEITNPTPSPSEAMSTPTSTLQGTPTAEKSPTIEPSPSAAPTDSATPPVPTPTQLPETEIPSTPTVEPGTPTALPATPTVEPATETPQTPTESVAPSPSASLPADLLRQPGFSCAHGPKNASPYPWLATILLALGLRRRKK